MPLQAENLVKFDQLFLYGTVSSNKNGFEVGENSGVFLKLSDNKSTRCTHLSNPGFHSKETILTRFHNKKSALEFFSCNLKALALKIKSPSNLIVIPEPKGTTDYHANIGLFFEDIWHQLILEDDSKFSAETLFAASLWFINNSKNYERAAYILEFAYKRHQLDWFLRLHHDAYKQTSPLQIETEVNKTKRSVKELYSGNKNIAVLIGIQDYGTDSGWSALKTPLNDIKRLKYLLVSKYNYFENNIHMLPNATHQDMINTLKQLQKKVDNKTNLLIYYAGHGVVDELGEYFWVPKNGDRTPNTWIYTEYIMKYLKRLDSLHTLLVADSCFSGVINTHQSKKLLTESFRKLYRKKSRQVITSGSTEPVLDGVEGENSVFAKNFIRILENQPAETPLSVQELFIQLKKSVVEQSNQTPTYDRIPNSQDSWGEFYFTQNIGNYALTSIPDSENGGLSLTSIPTGSDVYLNDEKVGKTPYRNNQLNPGIYMLSVEHPLHISLKDEPIEIKKKELTEKYVELLKNYGVLKIETIPNNALIKVYDEDETLITQTYSPNDIKLFAGEYEIELSMDNDEFLDFNSTIEKNKTRSLKVNIPQESQKRRFDSHYTKWKWKLRASIVAGAIWGYFAFSEYQAAVEARNNQTAEEDAIINGTTDAEAQQHRDKALEYNELLKKHNTKAQLGTLAFTALLGATGWLWINEPEKPESIDLVPAISGEQQLSLSLNYSF